MTKITPKKNKCKKVKWLSEEALQIAEKRKEAKAKEKMKDTPIRIQGEIRKKKKKAFLNDWCKVIEENNRMRKTRDLFKKIRDIKRTFYGNMGSIKERNGMDLRKAEDIRKRWQKYTEKLYKKDLNNADNHDSMITHLEPDILENEVKWALGSITMNKANGGDGIPVAAAAAAAKSRQ